MHFTALKDFHSKELGCDYVAGQTYRARPPSEAKEAKLKAKRSMLIDLLQQWAKEGKIAFGRTDEARVSGVGRVE